MLVNTGSPLRWKACPSRPEKIVDRALPTLDEHRGQRAVVEVVLGLDAVRDPTALEVRVAD